MKIRLMLFLVILSNFLQLKALVILDEVNIQSEFYGPFSKNTAEFIFYNDSKESEQETICYFELNSSAFASNLWLEIDDKLVLDETFRVDTGTAIYNKITKRRKDPALLTKRDNDSYVLSIYPFDKHQIRRVVIEYYSTLETIDDNLTWLFKIENNLSHKKRDSSIIYLNAIFNVPLNTMISNNNSDYWLANDQPLKTSNLDKTILKVKFPNNLNSNSKAKLRIYDYDNEMLNTKDSKEINKDIHSISNIPEFIESFIENFNHLDYKFFNTIEKEDSYLNKFLNYIEKEHVLNAPYNQVYANWFSKNDSIFYVDENMKLKKDFYDSNNSEDYYSIPCSFLKLFFEYLSILSQNYQEQIRSRFLTEHTAKLVLESNEQIDILRENELKHESQYIPIKGRTSKFIAYEEVPFVIKKTKPFISDQMLKLFNIEGEVILQVEVFADGEIGQIEVLKSLISFVDISAIQAVKQWEFSPAKSAGKGVACWVTFPVEFYHQDIDLKTLAQPDSSYTVFNRNLKIQNDVLYEIDFDFNEFNEIKLYTKDFFDTIMQNPELIKLTYLFSIQNTFSKIGLLNNSNESILINK